MKYITLFLLLLPLHGFSQSGYEQQIQHYRDSVNLAFLDENVSPLTPEDRKNFTSLNYFPIDSAYRVEAKFIRTPKEKPFVMAATGNRQSTYVKYGEAYFELNGQKFRLNIYQNQSLKNKPGYEDYLFLPFTDATNGAESYGGGRYISLTIPAGDVLVIDFNKAYNPYCAYNDRYSCPIPPEQNDVPVSIEAGEKTFAEKE